MSDSSAFGFGKFIPGFDFLQNLTKAGSAMPKMSHWIAPTVSVDDLDKRITELKAVQFWLEQNSRALAATVQALEVQKMTLATLQGMNLQMGDIAKAFTVDPMAAMESLRQATQAAAGAASAAANAASPAPAPAEPPAQPPAAAPSPAAQTSKEAETKSQQTKASAAVDPLQWWGALTQQFQSIAQQTLSDAKTREAMERTAGVAQDAFKTAAEMASKITAQGLQQFQQATAAASRAPEAAARKAAPKREAPPAEAEQAPEPAPKPVRKTASPSAAASKTAATATRKKASTASAPSSARRSKPSSS